MYNLQALELFSFLFAINTVKYIPIKDTSLHLSTSTWFIILVGIFSLEPDIDGRVENSSVCCICCVLLPQERGIVAFPFKWHRKQAGT